ncbi:MAG TPA: hypothetical protein DD001_19055 [Microcoleaceae bacterium UBA10368]|nr:hypothetical protein [Microcoleaceae cyanobacterium UBA10368]HCV30918.1 hypothetical protein [Microcoleaceae cyanobacterium UBA9251]
MGITPTDKAEAISILTQSVKNSGRPIAKTPGVMGGDACIDKTRIPVWLLASYRNDGATDAS